MSLGRIVIFTQSPLSKAPRVVKEANCLVRNGYNVIIYSLCYDHEVLIQDNSLIDRRIINKSGANLMNKNYKSLLIRIERRIHRSLVKHFGIQTKKALGYNYKKYLKRLKEEKADLYIGHEEMSLALSKELINNGFKVAFDFEDFHSEDLLPSDRKYRPLKLLKDLEEFILKNAIFTLTTSDSLAQVMASKYNSAIPVTIYNSFHRNDRLSNKKRKRSNSLVWISQVIGPGRGIELLISGIRKARHNYKLTLIGSKDEAFCQELQKNLPSNLKLEISEFIPPQKIQSFLANFDLGLAFEELQPISRFLTITNKIFHYLNSGIAVLATNTQGQEELSLKSGKAIKIVEQDPQHIATALDQIFHNEEILEEMKNASKFFGQTKFCFENEEIKIIALVKNVFVCS